VGEGKKREQARRIAELQGPAPSDDEIKEDEFEEEMKQLEARQQVGDIKKEELQELAQGKNSRDLSLMHRRPIIDAPTTEGDRHAQLIKLEPEDSHNERELVKYDRGRKRAQKQRKRRAAAKKNKKKKKEEKEKKEEIERRLSFRGCGEPMKPGSRKPGGGAGGGSRRRVGKI